MLREHSNTNYIDQMNAYDKAYNIIVKARQNNLDNVPVWEMLNRIAQYICKQQRDLLTAVMKGGE